MRIEKECIKQVTSFRIIKYVLFLMLCIMLQFTNAKGVYASDQSVECPEVFFEGDYQDSGYTYSYHRRMYYKLVEGEYFRGDVSGSQKFKLNLTNADEIDFIVRGEFYCGHNSSCTKKSTYQASPMTLTVDIGNGRVKKSFSVRLKSTSGITSTFITEKLTKSVENLTKYNLGVEIVEVTWKDTGEAKCISCGNDVYKGFQLDTVYSWDFRGICKSITSDSTVGDNIVVVNANVNDYVKRCEWYMKFENDSEEVKLHDGLQDNGMYVNGADINHLTLINIPNDRGKTAEIMLYTYDEHEQGLTGLVAGRAPYSTDISILAGFKTGLTDTVARTGQTVTFDLASKIPSDTRTIKWQQSQDGVMYSDSFPISVFSNSIYTTNNATLKINGALASMNGYSFRCVCADEYGRESISEPVKLYVTAPSIYYNNTPVNTLYINGKRVS